MKLIFNTVSHCFFFRCVWLCVCVCVCVCECACLSKAFLKSLTVVDFMILVGRPLNGTSTRVVMKFSRCLLLYFTGGLRRISLARTLLAGPGI